MAEKITTNTDSDFEDKGLADFQDQDPGVQLLSIKATDNDDVIPGGPVWSLQANPVVVAPSIVTNENECEEILSSELESLKESTQGTYEVNADVTDSLQAESPSPVEGSSPVPITNDEEETTLSNNSPECCNVANFNLMLPWGIQKEKTPYPLSMPVDPAAKPGQFVLRSLFAEFAILAEKKIDSVLSEPLERQLSKSLQRGEDSIFDQIVSGLGTVAEHCLPSLLRTLFSWYERQEVEMSLSQEQKHKFDSKGKGESSEKVEKDQYQEKRDLAVEFIFCLVLIEVLKQLPYHPGHEDLVNYIENLAFKHFKYREGVQNAPNAANIHIIADLYAEVIGVLAQSSRFQSVRKKFMAELKELRSREQSPFTSQSIISLLMGMKFFRVKMVPIEEFEASFQYMQECAQYFLEVKDKDIKHALAGLFVEILVPVAATVKNEVNVPVLKNFVEMLYSQTLDMCTKKKHSLALFPLVTCLLCVSQKSFFLQNWHYFLAMCLSNLKNKDPKMSRVALESLYRLLWVYMIRIKCESNTATQSRLQSIVNSLFPRGSKAVVPRETPLNIFVKIIQFVAQERLDFAMREIVFDLLSVGRPIKIILTPERMSIGLRAFLVVADSLQQKEGDPPMPRTVGVLPSGNTLRVKKTFLNKMLSEDTAKTIGMSQYYPFVRKAFDDILRALDVQFGRPLMMTMVQNVNKEPDEMITGERKPKIDLFRTCVAAIPRLIPDGMNRHDLVDLLSRLTVHIDEELRGLAFQSLQTMMNDFPDWREDVIQGFIQFILKEVNDTFQQLLDNSLRMLLQFLNTWKNTLTSAFSGPSRRNKMKFRLEPSANILHYVEGFGLVMLCNCRLSPRRLAIHILKEVKCLILAIPGNKEEDEPVVDVIDKACASVTERCLPLLSPAERSAIIANANIDVQWLCERGSYIWPPGPHDSQDNTTDKAKIPTIVSGVGSVDTWAICLMGFLERECILSRSASAVTHSWPIIFSRVGSLLPYIDPNPITDNRASLLRSSTTIKKPLNERDIYTSLWRNYIMFACRVAPPVSSPVIRCASPELCLGSSPDSITSDRSDNRSPSPSVPASNMYKLIVPLLRCENSDVRDAVVMGLGKINHEAIKDLMEEMMPYIKEAIDRKQENMRRRRRRDALRVQLVKVMELIAAKGTFGISRSILKRDSSSLNTTFIEYIDGARLFLESENDKDIAAVQDIKIHFCGFIHKLIKSFPLDGRNTLIRPDLRRNLFYLFGSWSGRFGIPFGFNEKQNVLSKSTSCTDAEFLSLQAMSSVLCCGLVFDPQGLADDGYLYSWLDILLGTHDEKIYELAQETIVLLLEFNPDISTLLDWVVDRCYTGSNEVADGCFNALTTIFSAREYPCDHYTAIINVTLMNTGCPRPNICETALQLLQVLDKRFFGSLSPVMDEQGENGDGLSGDVVLRPKNISTLDVLLSTSYSRSQQYLSKQLAQLHPELTMPMFSEITHRFQTARHSVQQTLLQYLLPWLYNMELVDPSVPPCIPLASLMGSRMADLFNNSEHGSRSSVRKEGWGSAEASEMVLNNLFYITAKFGDEHPKEVENLWCALSSCWTNNLRVILRYLFIVSGIAPNELLPYSKRVVVYLGRAQPERLVEEMMTELQAVETLNCLIERTETPPFFRLTSIRKTSSHSDNTSNSIPTESGSKSDLVVEKGTLHTKRHSGGDAENKEIMKIPDSGSLTVKSTSSLPSVSPQQERSRNSTLSSTVDSQPVEEDNFNILRKGTMSEEGPKTETPQPHPLPMPEYGGYFAPLTEYLPDSSQPISGFHRCNLAVIFLVDLVVDGIDIDWTIHVPLMLHIIFLGMDHTRSVVHDHCKKLLLNLLIVLSGHSDHLTVARILLNSKTEHQSYGLTPPFLNTPQHNFTETDAVNLESKKDEKVVVTVECDTLDEHPEINDSQKIGSENEEDETKKLIGPKTPIEDVIKSMISFLSNQSHQLWIYEDITSKVWMTKSTEQLTTFFLHVLRIFKESLPIAHIEERWAQIALHIALSCPSRHYAGRSLQIFRTLKVTISSRMLSDILSRLVETVAEQGEDMQGYVTEIMLTLEAAVESLDPEQYRAEFMKELMKFNSKDGARKNMLPFATVSGYPSAHHHVGGHARSTSFSAALFHTHNTSSLGGFLGSPTGDIRDVRHRSGTEADPRTKSTNLSRSRSAQSLKFLADQSTMDDRASVLAQLFWISVSLLESDYEYEVLLAVRLMDKVLGQLAFDQLECREKIEKLQMQLKWNNFPGVHALLLKGCTSPLTYESTLHLLAKFTLMLDSMVVDPSQATAFPINIIALLPYLLQNYDDPNQVCIQSAENIAQVCMEKCEKLENLATVMTLYSKRTFSKESFQWTKCVVKYLYDTYAHLSLTMMVFLVEVLEKGPQNIAVHVLSIIYCMLHYLDMNSAPVQPVNTDMLRVVARYVEGTHWKEAMKILKLVVTRSSTLSVPPSGVYMQSSLTDSLTLPSSLSFADTDSHNKKELPGRTMEFTFDISQTPVIGRRYQITRKNGSNDTGKDHTDNQASPRRSASVNQSDVGNGISSWKRPWLSQARTRERLVNLLMSCGQRVGLPKSPSVIFSQSSDLLERHSSMCSSTEEVSIINNDMSAESKLDDTVTTEQQFGVFKDFDFLEYELESHEGESIDNFNWGVRRRSLSNLDGNTTDTRSSIEIGTLSSAPITRREESSDDEIGSVSPVEDISNDLDNSNIGLMFPPTSLPGLLDSSSHRQNESSHTSSSSTCSDNDLGDITPSNNSPSFLTLVATFAHRDEVEEIWRSHVNTLMSESTPTAVLNTPQVFTWLFKETKKKFGSLTQEACHYLTSSDHLCNLTSHFLNMLEIILVQAKCPLYYTDVDSIIKCRLVEKVKFCVLEIQEHFETFLERKEHTIECLDGIKTSLKVLNVGEHVSMYTIEEQRIELCRCLYKIHFQIVLLFESFSKLVTTVSLATKQNQVQDLWGEVVTLRDEINQGLQEPDTDSPSAVGLIESLAISRSAAEQTVIDLASDRKWHQLVKHIHAFREIWPNDIFGDGEEDDVDVILNLHCRHLCEKKSGIVIITKPENEPSDVCARLMNANIHLSTTLRSLEQPSRHHERLDSVLRKTEC